MVKLLNKISAVIVFLSVLFLLASCGKSADIEIMSARLIKTDNGINIKYVIKNSTDEAIKDLKITVNVINDKQVVEKSELSYSLSVESGQTATLGKQIDYACSECVATEYSYTNQSNKKITGSFTNGGEASFELDEEDEKISTRAQLAEALIDDVKSQFLSQGFISEGHYDSQKKQLIIASYTKNSYSASLQAYSQSPSEWEAMAQSVAKMSDTCLEEFEKYGFKDVQVSVGVMSSDDVIMISATNGEIIDMLGQ